MEDFVLEYNSQKDKLVIPEYGRNVQNLINHAKTIEDDEERQHFVEHIVNLINQMNPTSKNFLEYKDKIWKDIFKIAGFDINVMPPNGEIPTPETTKLAPEQVPYPLNVSRFRHYGHNVQIMIDKAIAMEDEETKQAFTQVIASYMKLAYLTWNREHYVNDNIIINDLTLLSDGKLTVIEGESIDGLANSTRRKKPSQNYKSHSSKGRYKKSNKSHSSNNYRRRK